LHGEIQAFQCINLCCEFEECSVAVWDRDGEKCYNEHGLTRNEDGKCRKAEDSSGRIKYDMYSVRKKKKSTTPPFLCSSSLAIGCASTAEWKKYCTESDGTPKFPVFWSVKISVFWGADFPCLEAS
jgi:hypothetical protein